MNYMSEGNPHCTNTKWCSRYHYEGNLACGVNDKFDRIELCARQGGTSWPVLTFEMPRQKYDLEKVEQLMKLAYEYGASDAKAAIGKMMRELCAL